MKKIILLLLISLFFNNNCFADYENEADYKNEKWEAFIERHKNELIKINLYNYKHCYKTKAGLLKDFPMLKNMKCEQPYPPYDPMDKDEFDKWLAWHDEADRIIDDNCNVCVQSIDFKEDVYYIIYGFSPDYKCSSNVFFRDYDYIDNKYIEIYSIKHNKVILSDKFCGENAYISYDKLVLPSYSIYSKIYPDGTYKIKRYEEK